MPNLNVPNVVLDALRGQGLGDVVEGADLAV